MTVNAQDLVEAHEQLSSDEAQLGIETAAIDEATRSVLDRFLQPRKRWSISSGLPVGGATALLAHVLEDGLEASRSLLERRRLRRLAQLAPDSLEPPDAAKP